MFNFNDWLKNHQQRLEDKKKESKMIEDQMKEYFQPERSKREDYINTEEKWKEITKKCISQNLSLKL